MIIILLISCMLTPLEIAFEAQEQDKITTATLVGFIFDFLFFVDVIVIFFSAFFNEDLVLIDDRKTIFKTYLFGWFSVDLVSSIPFSALNSGYGKMD